EGMGPCACPQWRRRGRGQAQGPIPSTQPPLVPTPLEAISKKPTCGSTNLVPLLLTIRSVRLAHTAGHLQLDQAVQLNRVLHREFLGDRLDEAVDDQR